MTKIPSQLIEAIRAKRSVLFLGAGASRECKNSHGDAPPTADGLRDILAQEFFGKPIPNRDVMAVAEMASEVAGGRSRVFEAVRKSFDGFPTSAAHHLIPQFYWRTIATTNYDLFVESAYASCKGRVQSLVKFVKDDEPVLDKMQSVQNPVAYLKLHGCLDHIHDKEIPLVLSREQYATYREHRTHLFNRLQETAGQSAVIFIGYRLDDPHIRDLIYKLNANERPRWYIVTPDAEEYDVNFWASKNIEVIKLRFGEFMAELDGAIPPELRKLTHSDTIAEQPIRKFFIGAGTESDLVRRSLLDDFLFIHSGMAVSPQSPQQFYEGYDSGWGAIVDRLDARRKIEDDLLYTGLLENEKPTKPVVMTLLGPAGAGKTIALKRTAYEAATASNALVLWLKDNGALRPEFFAELHDLTAKTIYLFVDQIGLHSRSIVDLLKSDKLAALPLVIISAERDADWHTYCGYLQQEYDPVMFRIGHLSQPEVQALLDLLDRYHCLGDLQGMPRDKQIEAFMEKGRADRQLLVALHELTRGKPFEDIVLEEYSRILPDTAQQMYLDIATMHQFSVKVRAGTISRISGVRFKDYEEHFFNPLKNIVRVADDDAYTGDYYYQTRHPRVAALVFRQVCSDDVTKGAQFRRIISGFDIGYSVDHRALEEIVRGRSLVEAFVNVEAAREIYQAAISVAPGQAFLHQQWAIFEYQHPKGSLAIAEAQASSAHELDPRNRPIIHTQAEIDRRRANVESSPLLRATLRRRARERLNEISPVDRFVTSSRCKIGLDELEEMQSDLSDEAKEYEALAYAEKIKDVESAISKAQQSYPDDVEIIQTEARLRTLLDQSDRALAALERARAAGPRGSGIAIRISRAYAARDRDSDAVKVLREELAKFPDDKPLHHALAIQLLGQATYDFKEVEGQLERSFSSEDQNYEDRYLLAQLLFAHGDVDKATRLFDLIDQRAPPAFRSKAPRQDSLVSAKLPRYFGTVAGLKNRFLFIRSGCYPKDIFGHFNDVEPNAVEALQFGADVNFRVRFNRAGPVAIDIREGRVLL